MAMVSALMCSLVGTFVKIASTAVSPNVITFSRFFFGSLTILLLCLFTKRKPKLHYKNIWIWIAIVSKCLNYFLENYALRNGTSYGNIICTPMQMVTICLCSAFFFGEKFGPRKLLSVILCITGILFISGNGRPVGAVDTVSLKMTVLFVIAGIGAGGFVLAQKRMLDEMEPIDMNLSVFLASSLIAFVPVSAEYDRVPDIGLPPLLALIGLGIITGAAFVLLAKSMKKLSLLTAGMAQNSTPVFTLLWGAMFWHETIGPYVIIGTILFIIGMVLFNVAPEPDAEKTDTQ